MTVQPGKEAVRKSQLQCAVQPVQQPGREIDDAAQKPAQETVLPGPGHHALPAQHPQQGAGIDLAVAPTPRSCQSAVQRTVIIDSTEHRPQVIDITLAQ